MIDLDAIKARWVGVIAWAEDQTVWEGMDPQRMRGVRTALYMRDLIAEVERLYAMLYRRDAVTVSVTEQIRLADAAERSAIERDEALAEVERLRADVARRREQAEVCPYCDDVPR